MKSIPRVAWIGVVASYFHQLRSTPHSREIEKIEQTKTAAKIEIGVVRQTIANYIDLMKPHVTVLLLGVTAASMAIAKQGLPPLALVIPTLLGGAMAAGSANCINCYIDRDIDQIMGRTQRRSLPSGRVEPRQALIFGIFLGIIASIVLTLFVNLLSAVLATSAILLRLRLHTRSQAHFNAEYRHRRRRRRCTGAGRLGSHHQHAEPTGYLALRSYLLLDTSTLLGPGAADPERL